MSTTSKETTAQKSAEKWLYLIDRSQYSESWSQTAPYFQNNVTQEEWQRTLRGVRQPLGEVLSREVASMQYTTSLPGSPDGEYVVIQYRTSFSNRQSAIETVTPMLDASDRWKVAGYYIN